MKSPHEKILWPSLIVEQMVTVVKWVLQKLPLVRTHFSLLTTRLVEALTGAAINIFPIRKELQTVRCQISA